METNQAASVKKRQNSSLAAVGGLLGAVAFCLSTKPNHQHFDYTVRIAAALMHGHIGLQSQPPSWLNEMVPRDGEYYSVFPLGAVLSMLPVALLQLAHLISGFPGRFVAGAIAGLCVYFFLRLAGPAQSVARQILLGLFPIVGTWMWCNLGFAGAWQIALGFALLGEAGALYFTLVRPRPLVAGTFFALAFGNRTEVILVLPVFLYLWIPSPVGEIEPSTRWWARLRQSGPVLAQFLIVPILLGLFTAAYNFARFHSIFDFGYSHIPNVLEEPWYRHGLFSLYAVPWNAYKMLFEGFESEPQFPFIQPYAFGCSIFLASPMLFLLFREGGKHRRIGWIAIALLTFALWCHGNPGGWQFSYRYAVILLPWFFLLILENGPTSFSVYELVLFVVSVAINAIATYFFLWTDRIHP